MVTQRLSPTISVDHGWMSPDGVVHSYLAWTIAIANQGLLLTRELIDPINETHAGVAPTDVHHDNVKL